MSWFNFHAPAPPPPPSWSDSFGAVFETSLRALADEAGTIATMTLGAAGWILRLTLVMFLLRPLVLVMVRALKRLRGLASNESGGEDDGEDDVTFIDAQASSKTKLADVAGIDEVKHEIEAIVDQVKNPKKYARFGAKPLRGVLLFSGPGLGKTLIARAIAGEAHLPFFSTSGASFDNRYVGVGASKVRALFRQARAHAPSIVFIDEIDAMGTKRANTQTRGTSDTLNQLLVEMDGFSEQRDDKFVIVIAATNRKDALDEALIRHGRFDRHIGLTNPDLVARQAILKVHLKPLLLDLAACTDGLDGMARRLALLTTGFNGASLATLCNDAAQLAAQHNRASGIVPSDFDTAMERMAVGLENRGLRYSTEDKLRIAQHEAGHTVTGWFLHSTKIVTKVSILPRHGGIGGFAAFLPEDVVNLSPEQLDHELVVLLAGRAAEQVLGGRISTGAQDDMQKATDLARRMITEFGMSKCLGHVSIKSTEDLASYSSSTRRQVEGETRRKLQCAYQQACALIVARRSLVEAVAQQLVERETLDHAALIHILGARTTVTPAYRKYLQSLELA